MTRSSILEYVEAVRGRYFGVTKKEKGRIINISSISGQKSRPLKSKPGKRQSPA